MTISNIENRGSKYMEMTRNRIGLHIGEKPHKITTIKNTQHALVVS